VIPPVGDRDRFTVIAHGDRRILGPISDDRLDALVERCPLAPGDHVLEVGSGKGEFLVRLLARWPGATAEGFDRNPWFLADARERAAEAGVTGRISFVETDAPGTLIAEREAAMAVAMGASGAFEGDQGATIKALAGATRPGGLVVFGDGLWTREPPFDALNAFGMALDELADGIEGFAALGLEAWLTVESVDVVSEAEWDDYEGSYAATIQRWATEHPDDPERDAFLARSSMMRTSYDEWRRDAFGFAIGRFRVTGEG
jgi:SAM-dependent methyltransferase